VFDHFKIIVPIKKLATEIIMAKSIHKFRKEITKKKTTQTNLQVCLLTACKT